MFGMNLACEEQFLQKAGRPQLYRALSDKKDAHCHANEKQVYPIASNGSVGGKQ